MSQIVSGLEETALAAWNLLSQVEAHPNAQLIKSHVLAWDSAQSLYDRLVRVILLCYEPSCRRLLATVPNFGLGRFAPKRAALQAYLDHCGPQDYTPRSAKDFAVQSTPRNLRTRSGDDELEKTPKVPTAMARAYLELLDTDVKVIYEELLNFVVGSAFKGDPWLRTLFGKKRWHSTHKTVCQECKAEWHRSKIKRKGWEEFFELSNTLDHHTSQFVKELGVVERPGGAPAQPPTPPHPTKEYKRISELEVVNLRHLRTELKALAGPGPSRPSQDRIDQILLRLRSLDLPLNSSK